ncbi:hypothetical protein BIW11_07012, partial [Tropilaelaps mercedesae]
MAFDQGGGSKGGSGNHSCVTQQNLATDHSNHNPANGTYSTS